LIQVGEEEYWRVYRLLDEVRGQLSLWREEFGRSSRARELICEYYRDFAEGVRSFGTVLGKVRTRFVSCEGGFRTPALMVFLGDESLKYYATMADLLIFELSRLSGVPMALSCRDEFPTLEIYSLTTEEGYLSAFDYYAVGFRKGDRMLFKAYIIPLPNEIEYRGRGAEVVFLDYETREQKFKVRWKIPHRLVGGSRLAAEVDGFLQPSFRYDRDREVELLRKIVGSMLLMFDGMFGGDIYKKALDNVSALIEVSLV